MFFWVVRIGNDFQFRKINIGDHCSGYYLTANLIEKLNNELCGTLRAKCENLSLEDELSDDELANERAGDKPPEFPRQRQTLSLVLWYADLISGRCSRTFIVHGTMHNECSGTFAAEMDSNLNYLCESFRIRVIPCLTTLKLIVCVHIAAHHGRVETGEILLAPRTTRTSQTPAVKDNILTKKDVSSAHQRVRLVVLGYCHSARGEIKAAKGVIGIARSFLGAGARSVLVAL